MPAAVNRLLKWFKANRILALILIGAFLASLFYSFYFQIKPVVDARAYDTIAQNIASGNGYREELQTDLAHDFAIARVGPLYEYFLAGIYKVFGHSYGAVWFWQAWLHALSTWLIYLTVLTIFADNEKKKKMGLWAAAIIGFYPDLIEISAMLMTETLYLFLACLMIYLFFLYFSKSGYWRAALLGLSSGLAVLARPPVLFLIPIVLFYFWRQKLWRPALLFLAVLILVFLPWTTRNYLVYKELMPFGAAGNFNFWIGNYHGGNGEQEPTQEQREFTLIHGVKEINGESMKQFKNFLRDYPAEFVKLTVLRINKYFSISRPMGFWFYQKGIGQMLFVFSSALASIFLFVLGFGGIIRSIIAKKKELWYLTVFTFFVSLIIFVTVVETRYRFQIYPPMAIFAGYFIVWLKNQPKKWWFDRALWLSAGLVFLNGLIDLLLNIERVRERIGFF